MRAFVALIDVSAAFWQVWISNVANMAVAAEGTRHVEAVSIIAAPVCLGGTLVNVTALIVRCWGAIEVPSWRRIGDTFR